MDILFFIANVVCTAASVIGAIKSVKYYKKSKWVSIYANTNEALLKVSEIGELFSHMLQLANKANYVRGQNPNKMISGYGKRILDEMRFIKGKLTAEDGKIVDEILTKYEFTIYIDKITDGSAFPTGEIIFDDQFIQCQECVGKVQACIKKMIEEQERKIN